MEDAVEEGVEVGVGGFCFHRRDCMSFVERNVVMHSELSRMFTGAARSCGLGIGLPGGELELD